MENYEIVVIGGGPAGLAAAISAKKSGMRKVLILGKRPGAGWNLKSVYT